MTALGQGQGIPELAPANSLLNYLNVFGVFGALVLFVVLGYFGKLMWRREHDRIVELLNEKFASYQKQMEEKVAGLERQLEAAIKRGNEWQELAWNQRHTVDRAIEKVPIAAAVTGKTS